MDDLIEPKNTKTFLKEHGIRPRKSLGQNFLVSRQVLDRIIEGAAIASSDVCLEIGAGIGTVTQRLCETAGRVIAVEKDPVMIPLLKENLSRYDNCLIVNEDFLKADIKSLLGGADSFRIVGNLPYYITTPIVMSVLESDPKPVSIAIMIQKEVADRMRARPGTKDYGALTLAVDYYADVNVVANVPPDSFIPRPGVDSAVVVLKPREDRTVSPADPGFMFSIIKAAFGQRRKTLINALSRAPGLDIDKAEAEAAVLRAGLDINIRGEMLSLSDFSRLSDILKHTEKT